MKKLIRLAALCLVIIILCTSFTGCARVINNIKASEARLLENGNIQANGTEYILLPEGEYLLNYDYADYDTRLFFAEEGVPVMISYVVSENSAFLLNDGMFVELWATSGEIYEYDESYYCRADLYEGAVEQIKNGIVYSVYGYEKPVDSYSDEFETVYLTEDQCALVASVFATVKPKAIPADTYMDYDRYVCLNAYSSDLVFYSDGFDLCSLNGKLYLEVYTENGSLIYYVPQEHYAVFEEILDDGEYDYSYYYDDYYDEDYYD